MTPNVGDGIAGRYELRERIGAGGFSSVWRALDRTHDRDVALKFPAFESTDRDRVLRQFRREVEAMAPLAEAITPSSVVRYVDASLDAEPRYLGIEFVQGDPLVELFGTDALGTGVRRRIVGDLAETLDFLHRNGLLYLDLKTENVMVRPSGRPVLIDFNTAVRIGDEVETLFHPDQFKAPELVVETGDATEVGPWSDVYAWGKLAFYLLTGVKVPTDRVPDGGLDPLDHGGSCSADLAAIVQRATRPDRTERQESGMELSEAVAATTDRGELALLRHLDSDVRCIVGDDDSIGRLSDGTEAPEVVLPDPERHVSPRHARFDRAFQEWSVEDTSLNGTYVWDSGEWTVLLSREARRARAQRTGTDVDDVPETAVLTPGTVIAPVHPEYGIQLEFSTLPADAAE